MIPIIRRNFGYKLLSVAVAVILYLIANGQQNPHVSSEVYIQPQVVGLPDDMVVRIGPPGEMVTVSGPTVNVNAFKAQPTKATVDVSKSKPGLNRLPIIYRATPGGLDMNDQQPYTEVTLERKARQRWDVDVDFNNTPPPGSVYIDPIADPRKVTVSGLASEVARVGRITAIVNNPSRTGAVFQDVRLVAQDTHQQVVDTVQIDPPSVRVSLKLKPAPAAKSVLLSASMTGSPAPGFVVTGYEFIPRMVTVTGSSEMLGARSSLVVPVAIDNISETVTKNITIAPPAGLRLQNPEQSSVRIRIEVQPVTQGAAVPSSSPTPTAPGADKKSPL